MTFATIAGTLLMIASQATAWYLVTNCAASSRHLLYSTVCGVATFYCLWALYLYFFDGRSGELGMYTMGLVAVCTFFQRRLLSVGASALVTLQFGYAMSLVYPLTCDDFAQAVGKSNDSESVITFWCWTFRLYLVSSLVFWGFVGVTLFQSRDPSVIDNNGRYGRV
mmetsp:Transcript_31887/g.66546  ORF Transcript_31887/g.66546 Transcript_31887/m.66546 type:complete len:166 (-) Transcript_31887:62-559(-)|eukprot:CAMPEP_0172468238 /NCGR_PEP_ID=MMETSP1065-20121228/60875_1 /TAXON_ID=265537 /ORGANISM="Amphiprora paludosa, Strain CCMP125" /LENGTH=165 /DNA_ID=CAMNT_0013225591 /DNA_START=67 /DNA_END=564 /DNA_ORIENTATION=+